MISSVSQARPWLSLFLIAALFYDQALVAGESSFLPSKQCTSPHYFDTTSYSCSSCSTNQIATGNTSVPCTCATGYWSTRETPSTCTSCLTSNTPSWSDRSGCTTCGSGATFNAVLGDCECVDNKHVLVETDAAGAKLAGGKVCLPCPTGGIVLSSNRYKCIVCPDSLMTRDATDTCVCPTGYTLHTGSTVGSTGATSSCVLSTDATMIQSLYNSLTWSTVTFPDTSASDSSTIIPATIRSAAIDNYFLPSAIGCRIHKVPSACQTVVNLCVLALLSPTHEICRFVIETNNLIATPPGPNYGFVDWKPTMPWLFYSDSWSSIHSTAITSSFRLQGGNSADLSQQTTMSYYLAGYTLNGTFLGAVPLDSQLQLCDADPLLETNFLRFGTKYQRRCTLKIQELFNAVANLPKPTAHSSSQSTAPVPLSTVFLELFMVDSSNTWFPVPVKVLNLRVSGVEVNRDSSGETYSPSNRLVRRFYLADSLGGIDASSPSQPAVLTWASKVTLRVAMQDKSTSKIHPPLLVVEYATRPYSSAVSATTTASSTSVVFTSEYVKDLEGADTAAIVVFSLGIALVFAIWVLKLCAWCRSDRSTGIGLGSFLKAIALALGTLGETLFWVTFAFSAYIFLFFKAQQAIYVLLPTDSSVLHTHFPTMIYIAFFSLLLSMLQRLIQQMSNDIVLIDWETAKPVVHPDIEKPRSVSVWRKVFVANKFVELQTVRDQSLHFTLFFLLFLLIGAGLEGLATAQPDGTNLSFTSAPMDPLLRFFMSSVVFLGIAGVQRLVRFLILDRFIPTPASQFVDILNNTNISVCIIDYHYHMFYLHGKSVHSHADASMEELHRQMAHEKRDWVQQRGLVHGHCAFSLFMTPQFRSMYDSEYAILLNRHILDWERGDINSNARNIEMKGMNGMTDLVDAEVVKATDNLTRFLIDFFDNHLHYHKWEYYDRSFIEERLDLPPHVRSGSDAVNPIAADTRGEFTRTLLLGIEHHLLILYVVTYAMFDIWFQSTYVSALVVALVDWLITAIRARWGRINISAKTLIDQRFLS